MAVVYRPHRGSLDEAMSGIKEFNNTQEMADYLYKEYEKYHDICSTGTITWEKYGDGDHRIGWPNSYIISLDNFGVLGFFTEGITKEQSLKCYKEWLDEFDKRNNEYVSKKPSNKKVDPIEEMARTLDEELIKLLCGGK